MPTSSQHLVVAYLTEKAGLGGGETSLLNLMQCMAERGHTPLLLCPPGALERKAREHKLLVHTMDYPDVHLRAGLIPTFSLSTMFSTYRILKKYAVDIVHVESLLALYYGGMASRLARIPCVATYHGYWPLRKKVLRAFLRWFVTGMYPVSASVAEDLKEVALKQQPRTMPLGFSLDFLSSLPSRQEARRILGLPDGRPIIMQVARFQAIKGHMHVLDALEVMLSQDRDFDPLVVFVGGVMEPASPDVLAYKASVEARASQPGLRHHVLFLGHRDDIPLLMRAADVIVSPSEFESFSMIIIEAMAVGAPVVATAAGGPAEILNHNATGILVPPCNPAALAAAICFVISNPDWAEHCAKQARREATARFGPQARYERLVAEYVGLIGWGN